MCRLRYRYLGRQDAVYLGIPGGRVDAIRAALEEWQSLRRTELQLATLSREAGRQLRAARQRLAVPLAERGYRLHGGTIRRMRHGPRTYPESHQS